MAAPPLPAVAATVHRKGKRKRSESGAALIEIVPEWRSQSHLNPTPWYTRDLSSVGDLGKRLHMEICDFYDYVRPQRFENDMRLDLVHRVQGMLNTRYTHFKGIEVKHFGSFAAGLYLPDADMDLVVMSQSYKNGGHASLRTSRKELQQFGGALRNSGLAVPNSVVIIPSAKVPIVKYVDAKTGLKVDVSFENDTGVIANGTYAEWIDQYPALPLIIALVKQFLLMRGLNEVHTGGLGGFSTSCLVVSILQLMPPLHASGSRKADNLDTIFMNFLNTYGFKFNTTMCGIQLSPPRIFNKASSGFRVNPNRPWGLCIVDPNRPDNDISGGSSLVLEIFKEFANAFLLLNDRMDEIYLGSNIRGSILAPLFAGDYSAYEKQRTRLRHLAMGGKW